MLSGLTGMNALTHLEDPVKQYEALRHVASSGYGYKDHVDTLRLISGDPTNYPKPSELYHAVIIAAYNEAYDVIQPTIRIC